MNLNPIDAFARRAALELFAEFKCAETGEGGLVEYFTLLIKLSCRGKIDHAIEGSLGDVSMFVIGLVHSELRVRREERARARGLQRVSADHAELHGIASALGVYETERIHNGVVVRLTDRVKAVLERALEPFLMDRVREMFTSQFPHIAFDGDVGMA